MKRSIILALLLSLLAIPSYSAKKEKPKPGVRVYDANGLDMGMLLGHQREWIQIFVDELGLSTAIHKLNGDLPTPGGTTFFDDYNCQGIPWTHASGEMEELTGQLFRKYMPDGEWHYYTVGEAGSVDYYSHTDGVTCFSPTPDSLVGFSLVEIPVAEIPPALLNFTLPFSYREN
jgi:hypothetical protein